jgi:hypothetical protein
MARAPGAVFKVPVARYIIRRPNGNVLFLRIESRLNAFPPSLQPHASTAPETFTTLPLMALPRTDGIRVRLPALGELFSDFLGRDSDQDRAWAQHLGWGESMFIGARINRGQNHGDSIYVFDFSEEVANTIVAKTWGPPITPHFQAHTLYWADPNDKAMRSVLDPLSLVYLDAYGALPI